MFSDHASDKQFIYSDEGGSEEMSRMVRWMSHKIYVSLESSNANVSSLANSSSRDTWRPLWFLSHSRCLGLLVAPWLRLQSVCMYIHVAAWTRCSDCNVVVGAEHRAHRISEKLPASHRQAKGHREALYSKLRGPRIHNNDVSHEDLDYSPSNASDRRWS